MSEVFNREVSVFKNTKTILTEETNSVAKLLENIKDGEYCELVSKVREGDKSAKLLLPTIAFQGLFDYARKKESFTEASGIIILDIDDIEDDLEDVKADIMDSSDHILACMVSPSGNGIKVLYYVDEDLVTAENYRQIGKQLVDDYTIYGDVDFLSITDCLIASWDENILINYDVEPAFIYVQTNEQVVNKTLEPRDESKSLYDDAEEFFETVLLNDITEKTNNNFHFIQVSVFDLVKFGFRHPQHDLSFVIDYAEQNFKRSSSNKQRFLESVAVAEKYRQSQWPYKLGGVYEDDEEEIDYGAMISNQADSNSTKLSGGSVDDVDDVDDDGGMVDYDVFFDNMLKVIEEGDRVGNETSLKGFSDIFRFRGTGILTLTGIPGHGKTEFSDACILDLARKYQQSTIVVGFEQSPEEHVIKLIRKVVGKNVTCPSWKDEEKLREAYDLVTKHIRHVDVTKIGGNIITILQTVGAEIMRMRSEGGDPAYVVIDPFNMLSIKGRTSGHEKIEEILRQITHFSHKMGVMVILVAHPLKMRRDEKTGEYEVPDFYSVKGSSAFYEMSYHGLVVYRMGYTTEVMVKVLKVKQNNLGIAGESVNLSYHKDSGRYIPTDEEGNELAGDHRDDNWIEKWKNNIEKNQD